MNISLDAYTKFSTIIINFNTNNNNTNRKTILKVNVKKRVRGSQRINEMNCVFLFPFVFLSKLLVSLTSILLDLWLSSLKFSVSTFLTCWKSCFPRTSPSPRISVIFTKIRFSHSSLLNFILPRMAHRLFN